MVAVFLISVALDVELSALVLVRRLFTGAGCGAALRLRSSTIFPRLYF